MSPEDLPTENPQSNRGQKTVEKSSSIAKFWQELKRRHVVRVGMVYTIVGWLVIQVANATFAEFGIPPWAYRFVVLMVVLGFPISVVVAWAFELTPEGIKTTKAAQVESEASGKQANKRGWFSLLFAAAVPTLIFGIAAGVFYVKFQNAEKQGQISEQTDYDKSIAVLPFANLSPDEQNAFFADGVHEDVLTNLSHIRELRVSSRTATLRYRDTVESPTDIGNQLNVRYLLEGSVRRVENRVRITAQLIDAQLDQHLWAENYTRDLDDIFAIQTEIAKEIAGQLQAVLSPEEVVQIERRPTENLEAYDYFLKVRQLIAFGNRNGDEKIAFLEKAVALDPDYAEAWAQLAIECIYWWDVEKQRDDPDLLAKAHHALIEAKRTGPDLPFAHNAQASIALREQQDVEAAIRHSLDAVAADPSYYYARDRLVGWYWGLGRLAEAEHFAKTMARIDPNHVSTLSNFWLLKIYQLQGRWNEARAQIQHGIEVTKDNPISRAEWQLHLIENEYFQTGDKDAYLAALDLLPDSATSRGLNIGIEILYSRDYRASLRRIDKFENHNFQNEFHGLSLGSKNLAAALHWFELSDQENWLIESGKAKVYLQEIVEVNPTPTPFYWAALAICYALEGDRVSMEEAMARTREISGSLNWKFKQQAACESLIAICYLVLGEHDRAIQILENADKMDSAIILNRELDLWFIFDRLRGNPRFDDLLKD